MSQENVETLLVDGGVMDGRRRRRLLRQRRRRRARGRDAGPIIEGYIGCIVIRSDGGRYLACAVRDPLAQRKPD